MHKQNCMYKGVGKIQDQFTKNKNKQTRISKAFLDSADS